MIDPFGLLPGGIRAGFVKPKDLTPCRNLKINSLPSSLSDQLEARSGTIDSRLFCGTWWSNMTRLLNTPIIGPSAAIVDSS